MTSFKRFVHLKFLLDDDRCWFRRMLTTIFVRAQARWIFVVVAANIVVVASRVAGVVVVVGQIEKDFRHR